MGLSRTYKKGQGMKIHGKGISIEAIVERIIPGPNRGAILKISGDKEGKILLSVSNPKANITEEILAYLPKRQPHGREIGIGYQAPTEYIFDRIDLNKEDTA